MDVGLGDAVHGFRKRLRHVMKLLEIVRGAKTAPDVLVTAMQLAKKIKKVASSPGSATASSATAC